MEQTPRKLAQDFGFIGIGGAGGKLVEAFRYIGGYKVLAANISSQDLAKLKMDEGDKIHLDLGLDGAGKDMGVGASAVKKFSGDLHHHISRKFTPGQHIMVCCGGGGGTGSGGARALVDICLQYTDKVGCFVTLPKDTEGEKVRHNTLDLIESLWPLAEQKKISLVFIDNEKIADMHSDWNVLNFWKMANQAVTSLFHEINLVCAQDSEIHPFDPADYATIVRAGRCLIFGSLDIPVAEVQNDGIAKYMRDNLQHGLLAKGFEDSYAESKIAGAILMGSTDCMSDVPMDKLEMAFGVFNRMIGDGTVHRGIYVNDSVSLRVYSMIGNLPLPESRMKNLRRGK